MFAAMLAPADFTATMCERDIVAELSNRIANLSGNQQNCVASQIRTVIPIFPRTKCFGMKQKIEHCAPSDTEVQSDDWAGRDKDHRARWRRRAVAEAAAAAVAVAVAVAAARRAVAAAVVAEGPLG